MRVLVPQRSLDPAEWRARQILGILPPPELVAVLFFAAAIGLLIVR